LTGNFTATGTDMTFEGGYGVPVNVTRSYSANQADEGPLGIGWTLSVDIRSTAGGVLKSADAPVHSVPVAFKERSSAQTIDPAAVESNGSALQPASAVLATDASGKEETEQRDVDGVITTPPWDKNTNNPEYEFVTLGGNTYQILVANDTVTTDGTTYHYTKQGSYASGLISVDGSGSAEPSNVLKISTVTDRHGNVTEYHYKTGTGSANQATFVKANGTATEQKLDYILMPNGHQINFTWGNGTNAPTNRIRTADDNVSGGRTVTYGYDGSGNLTSVTSPAGLTTSYAYDESGYRNAGSTSSYSLSGVSSVLTGITDPRGLTTHIGYTEEDVIIYPYGVTQRSTQAYKVLQPNGVTTYYAHVGDLSKLPTDSYYYSSSLFEILPSVFSDIAAGDTDPFYSGSLYAGNLGGSPPIFVVGMGGVSGGAVPALSGAENWMKKYDCRTQDLVSETRYSGAQTSTLLSNRKMAASNFFSNIETTTIYNFMGLPLTSTMTEAAKTTFPGNYTATRVVTTDYSYWGADKYFQQKSIRTRTGSTTYRYTYADYYDSSASAGDKGMLQYVYDPAYASFYLDTSVTPPSGTPTDDYWKYQLKPSSATAYSGKFAYDSKGRMTDQWKLKNTGTTPWTYVQTQTSYGADGAPHWGQAYQVVEDYGSGHINRTTTNNGYTSWGVANDVTDGAGHRFYTTYDADGKASSVVRTDCSPSQTIATYTYGTSGLTNGLLTQYADGLSGVVNDFTYVTSGGGKGDLESVTETNGGSSYTVSYLYNGAGDKTRATYSTPSGTVKWGYGDYTAVGDPSGPGRAFQTMAKLDSSNNPTSEELQYSYDGAGRLLIASFAQTPQSGFTPSTGASYYDASHPASTRARAYYVYDASGRVNQVNYWFDTWNSGSNNYGTPEALISNTCSYEISTSAANYNRGLKTTSNFYIQDPGNSTLFSLDHTELFGYDNNSDYLTSASYNGGSTTTSWTYDPTGNRNDATVVDNLNRATTIGGVTRTYDISGNTLTKGSTDTYTWDARNHLSTHAAGGTTTTYAYRLDGMRVSKGVDSTHYSNYYYDGKMPIETASLSGSAATITRNCVGARGIDRVEKTDSSGTSVYYPLYDAHGNNVASLAKSGGSYNVGDFRSYDAWGLIRSGSTTGGPSGRYCGSVGHVQDDESGLTYMRARYYDPSTGRFISQDASRRSDNLFTYCNNDPVNGVDTSGEFFTGLYAIYELIKKIWEGIEIIRENGIMCAEALCVGVAGIGFLGTWFLGLRCFVEGHGAEKLEKGGIIWTAFSGIFLTAGAFVGAGITATMKGASIGVAAKCKAVVSVYMATLGVFIAGEELCEMLGL